jgi:hypothetical protein
MVGRRRRSRRSWCSVRSEMSAHRRRSSWGGRSLCRRCLGDGRGSRCGRRLLDRRCRWGRRRLRCLGRRRLRSRSLRSSGCFGRCSRRDWSRLGRHSRRLSNSHRGRFFFFILPLRLFRRRSFATGGGSPCPGTSQRRPRRGRRRERRSRYRGGQHRLYIDRRYWRTGRGTFGGTATPLQVRLELDDLIIFQTGQRRTLAGNPCFGAELHQFLAIQLQFFS